MTASFQIDLPKTWEAFDLTEESIEAIGEVLGALDPELAAQFEQVVAGDFDFAALDTESMLVLTNLTIFRSEAAGPIPVSDVVAFTESEEGRKELAEQGFTVLSTDSTLTIGDLRAGRILVSFTLGPVEGRQVRYMVQAEPTVIVQVVFATGADEFDELESLFEEIAASFRVLDSP